MNKTAIKNFAVWARNKLIADITYKAGLLGISEKEIKSPLPQSTDNMLFFDIGTKDPYSISGTQIDQRKKLIETIEQKAKLSDYKTAYKSVVEEVAYTWFNRLIAVRFMEVNDYLPSRIRVLSSESAAKIEPDLVTTPFDFDLDFKPDEKNRILQLKNDNHLDELFRMLFIKQCNALNAILPELFETTSDYTELLLNVAFTDKDGVVYHLVHDISEDDFNVSKEGQIEIIGWMYQYYNTEPKNETFALLKQNVKITKESIPAATQLFTPDWIVRYMVENSLGRLAIESGVLRVESGVKETWKYYLDEAPQDPEVAEQLTEIRESYKGMKPEDIKVIDPCMGSGHILVYAFDVLMQIYESCGYSQRDAAKSIVEHNIYGLDIDNRAYQLAYFAVMMKARQYNRRILDGKIRCNLCAIEESNGFNPDYLKLLANSSLQTTAEKLINLFIDAKEYGSILNVDIPVQQLEALQQRIDEITETRYNNFFDSVRQSGLKTILAPVLRQAIIMARKYDVVVTNPPYMGISNGDGKLNDYVKKHYPDSKSDLFAVFIEKCGQMTKKNCYTSMITQHAWMFLSSFEKLREKLLLKDTVNMAHLGARAFEEIGGEVVQTTAFVLRNSNITDYKATFARLVDYSSQKEKENAFISKKDLHIAQKENFSKIPGSPIAYWVSEKFVDAFQNSKMVEYSCVTNGMFTCDNKRFLRYWFEVNNSKLNLVCCSKDKCNQNRSKWYPYNKGGEFRKWYGNHEYVINFENFGQEIKEYRIKSGQSASFPGQDYYFRESLSWSFISSSKFGIRYYPKGFVFDIAGSSIFANDESNIYYFLGILASEVVFNMLNLINPTINYQAGDIRNLPIVISVKQKPQIDQFVQQNISISKTDWDNFETSWNFKYHPFLMWMGSKALWEVTNEKLEQNLLVSESYSAWKAFTETQFTQLKANEEELNRIFIEIYGLQDELTPEVEDKDVTIRKADLGRDIRSFVSYAVGCMFGRYGLGVDGLLYAGGAFSVKCEEWSVECKAPYVEYDGKLYHKNNFTLNTPNSTLELAFSPDKDNILPITDEEYFEDDIVGRFVEFVKTVYGAETLEQNLDFIANALGNKGDSSREIIRNYFLKDFYKDHVKIYQKRPIYWLFDSGKENGFKALIYMHRYDENTIGNLRIDYLHRMQRVYESEIARMQETIINSTNAREVTAAEKRKEKLTKQLKETKDYDEKIAHLALARIAIDLDDGVKVNYEKVQTGTDGKKLEVLAKI